MNMKPICRAPLSIALAHLSLFILGGCAVVDQYSSRAIEYNEQTAASKNSLILLNILRAAYREPLQFTDISTVTGTASAQGSLSADIPLRIGGTHFVTPQILSLNPSAAVSGGPNFSVANLSTQEFYQGLQAPVSAQVVANYAPAGVSPQVLLPLLVSEITFDEPNQVSVLRNTGSTAASIMGFRDFTKQLLKRGLSVAVTDAEPEWIGPVLSAKEASDTKLLAGLAQAMSASDSPLSFQAVKSPEGAAGDGKFRLGKAYSKKATLCFRNKEFPLKEKEPDYEVSNKNINFHANVLQIPGRKDIEIPKNMYCGVLKSETELASKRSVSRKSGVTLRSVEQIFLFLGDVVRIELGLNDGIETDLHDSDNSIDKNIPLYLFKVEQRLPANGEISANFRGIFYTVATDPSGADASSQVVAILSDLMALESSAKSLPAPNVIAVAP